MTTTNEMTMKTIEQEQNLDQAFAEAVSSIPEELIEVEDDKQFERSSETIAIKTIVNRYKKGTILIPSCQRLYVWKQSDINLLIDSINHNFPIGIIMLGECDGKKYLLDGLQRLTSIVKSLSDPTLSKEQKKQIMEYRIIVETIRGMNVNDMNAFIQRCNMGVKMSSATKHRAGLPASLFTAVVNIAGKPAFRTLKMNRTFTTSAHNELIAMHSLLTAAGVMDGKNTAAELCKRLKDNEDIVMQNLDTANTQVDFITNAFVNMKSYLMKDRMSEKDAEEMADHISVKGFNVNFISAMFRMMKRHPEMAEEDIQYMAYQIFNGKNAVKEYASTTSRNSSDEKNMNNRLVVLEDYFAEAREYAEQHKSNVESESESTDDMLEPSAITEEYDISEDHETEESLAVSAGDNTETDDDNIEIIDDVEIVGETAVSEMNPEDYQNFCEMMNGTDIQTKDETLSVKFEMFNDEEKEKLFSAYETDNNDDWDSVVSFRAAMVELGD